MVRHQIVAAALTISDCVDENRALLNGEGDLAISEDELAVLVKVTGTFENSGDPYEGVSGDFDGQGISCGVLQWNIGQGSLQPLVRAAGKPAVAASMPTFGD